VPKLDAELGYWRGCHRAEGGHFENAHYERLMLALAGEQESGFVAGKVVADFGCGPRGSLVWASAALLRIGIDVLAARYWEEFPDVADHRMVYLTSSERKIPLPSSSVDVMFSVNALDHVADLPAMCSEILRVLKPGGLLAASLNLEEQRTAEEPQQLSEAAIRGHLLAGLEVEQYRATDKVTGDVYGPLLRGEELTRTAERPGVLWVRARKPGS
jgi:SAM-dependent methyltransferase